MSNVANFDLNKPPTEWSEIARIASCCLTEDAKFDSVFWTQHEVAYLSHWCWVYTKVCITFLGNRFNIPPHETFNYTLNDQTRQYSLYYSELTGVSTLYITLYHDK